MKLLCEKTCISNSINNSLFKTSYCHIFVVVKLKKKTNGIFLHKTFLDNDAKKIYNLVQSIRSYVHPYISMMHLY